MDNKIAFEFYDTKAYIIGTHAFDHGLMVVEIDNTTYEIDTSREKRRTKPLFESVDLPKGKHNIIISLKLGQEGKAIGIHGLSYIPDEVKGMVIK